MLKEAMQYIIGLKRPEVVEVNGKSYTPLNLDRIDKEADVAAIKVRSLSGLVDYAKSHFDHERPLLVHVASPTKVYLYDALNDDNDRRCYVEATALLPNIVLNRFMPREEFQIQMQASFVTKESDKLKVIEFIGSIVQDSSVTTADNGYSQTVTAKQGVATVGKADAPGNVLLKPFRTFVEVTQPASEFVLRLKEGPQAGLFEADGGAWELNAMANIAEFLEKELAEQIEQKLVYVIS